MTGFPRLNFQTSASCVKFINVEGIGLVWFGLLRELRLKAAGVTCYK